MIYVLRISPISINIVVFVLCQALRENDMESYMKLVSETKNQRLQFLLNETDSYIATINRMIEEQRGQINPKFAPSLVSQVPLEGIPQLIYLVNVLFTITISNCIN
jgi:hypothetical protein